MGLIDTLSSGFRVVQRRPWLVLLPVLLDLWLWLGPRWSIQPLADSLLRLLAPDNLPPEMAPLVEPYQQLVTAAGANFNLWWLVDSNPAWLRAVTPGLIQPVGLGAAPGVVEMPAVALLLWAPLVLLLGVALGSAFLAAVASQLPAPEPAQDEPAAPGRPVDGVEQAQAPLGAGHWLRRALRTFVLATLFGLLIVALIILASLLLSVALTPVFVVAPGAAAGVASMAALLLGWLGVVAYILLYFVLAAVVSDGVGLRQAVWRSVNVVSRNFWSTLGLVLLVTVILWGFGLIWQRLAASGSLGVAVAILGNAVLITGLTAARLIFYRDRCGRWLAALSGQQTATKPPAKPHNAE